MTDVFVPDENFFELPFGASFAPDPIFGKFPEVLVLSHGTVANRRQFVVHRSKMARCVTQRDGRR